MFQIIIYYFNLFERERYLLGYLLGLFTRLIVIECVISAETALIGRLLILIAKTLNHKIPLRAAA